MKGLINLDDVYREWDAQIRKVLDAGISITHIDGHQHLHMWNKFFPIALALGKKYKIPCMRVPDESFFDISAKIFYDQWQEPDWPLLPEDIEVY
ncbi:MAG: ChbG/HpnK family deacetylase [Dialister invisus]